jgi:hypothetical protein
MLKKLWEKYDQVVFGIVFFIFGFMARGVFNWLVNLPFIGWMFK